MPTDTERRLNELERLVLYGGGVATGALASGVGRTIARRGAGSLGRAGLRGVGTVGRLGLMAAQRHPVGAAATLAYLGYIHRDDIRDVAEALGEGLEDVAGLIPGRGPTRIAKTESEFKISYKRALSKANKAVRYGMTTLKAGTKASTGADRGVVPIGAFKIATKAAGLANPKTPSKIGKGKSKIKNLARKIKKWWK